MSIEKNYGPAEYLALLEKLVEQTNETSNILTKHLELQKEHIKLQKEYIGLFNSKFNVKIVPGGGVGGLGVPEPLRPSSNPK